MKVSKKRKICFIITSPIHYSRNFLILRELNKDRRIDLHVIVGGSAALSRFTAHNADTESLLKNDGFSKIHRTTFSVEGDTPIAKAKSSGLGIIEFSSLFHNIQPDLVIVRGDRFEVLAATIAAAYLNIPIAHIEGGDETGTLDESVRYAITKFAHLHFTTNERSQKRLIAMGEQPGHTFNYGSPDVEVAAYLANATKSFSLKDTGSGFTSLDIKKPYLMVMYHPVVTELGRLRQDTRTLLSAIHELAMPVLWFWPNADAGSEIISRELRTFNDTTDRHQVHFMRYVRPEIFIGLLRRTLCLVGNSSAGIKECAYLGVPVVNIGSRQQNRLRSSNVLDVVCAKKVIKTAIHRQIAHGRYHVSKTYYTRGTAKKIVGVLAKANVNIQKSFFEPKSKNS